MRRWIFVALTVSVTPLAAQQDSLLREAVRFATEGQADTAQAIVNNRLRAVPRTDPAYPEILFTAGLVSESADEARSHFRRVSIEYSNSAWADRALLRLAQLAYGMGEFNTAQRSAERVLIDYPFSEVRAGAAFLLARMHLDRREVERGCDYLNQATLESGNDVELVNRAAFYIQRCDNIARNPTPEPAPDSGAADGSVTYSVQVAAVSSVRAADEVMRGLRREGHTSEVIRDGGLFKVRVGRFVRRADADALRDRIRATTLGSQAFVVESR